MKFSATNRLARCWRQPVIVVAFVCLVGAGCTGSSAGDNVAASTPEQTPAQTAVETTEAATPTEVPPTSVPELTQEQKLAAAVAAFDAQPQPSDLFAYDHLEARPNGTTGQFHIKVCGWKTDTVFDEVIQATYSVTTASDGTPDVDFLFDTNKPTENCTNTELIDSALQFIRDLETFWSGVLTDPTSFDEETGRGFWTQEAFDEQAPIVARWVDEGLAYRGTPIDGSLPDSAVTDVLTRSYEGGGIEAFELVACRPLSEDFGLYRQDVLVDDFRGESPQGTEAIVIYLLTREADKWMLFGSTDGPWVDCQGAQPSWYDAVTALRPRQVPWEFLDS